MKGLYIATEDALSEAVADRLVAEVNGELCVSVRMGRKGSGYLKQKLPYLLKTAHAIPVLLLTDLDREACPPTLLAGWLGSRKLPQDMLLRVVVREIEAWLLADWQGFSRFSGVPVEKVPRNPETLDDPKQVLLALVRRFGKRVIKSHLLPERGSTAKIGLGYNEALSCFVMESWSVERAAANAESLDRTCHCLRALSSRLSDPGRIGNKKPVQPEKSG